MCTGPFTEPQKLPQRLFLDRSSNLVFKLSRFPAIICAIRLPPSALIVSLNPSATDDPLHAERSALYGVTSIVFAEGQIAWARLYLEETEREGADITETVRRMAGQKDA